MRPSLRYLAFLGLLFICSAEPSLARGNDWSITDGQGEKLQIKHGLFGNKQQYVEDRFGDKFYNKKGLFGSKETEVSVLGNTVSRKKGWFGGTDYQGKSMLGDTIKTKKGLFGRRKTEVNVSGISNVVRGLMNGVPQPLAGAGGFAAGKEALNSGQSVTGGNCNPLDQDIMKDPH